MHEEAFECTWEWKSPKKWTEQQKIVCNKSFSCSFCRVFISVFFIFVHISTSLLLVPRRLGDPAKPAGSTKLYCFFTADTSIFADFFEFFSYFCFRISARNGCFWHWLICCCCVFSIPSVLVRTHMCFYVGICKVVCISVALWIIFIWWMQKLICIYIFM